MSLSLSLLRSHWCALSEAMPAATAGDVDAVHRARVASRRLREALPVLSAGGPPEAVGRLRTRVRAITRALGPVRELDVALEHLEDGATRVALSPATLDLMRQALIAERRSRRSAMLQQMKLVKLDKLTHRIDALSDPAIAEALTPETKIAEAVGRVGRRARVLETAIDRAGGLYLPDRLHAVRVAAKKLRYVMEIERDLRRSRAVSRLTRLKAMQDLLGRMHDVEILIVQTRTVQGVLAARHRAAVLELDTLVRSLEDECREWHAVYLRERTAFVQLCGAIREAADAGRPTVAA